MIFLELVNRAIQEAGKDQDDLTSSNFTAPPNPRMYNRFKNWVAESYQQLQMARNEWEFKSGRAYVTIYPSVLVDNGYDGSGDPDEKTFIGQDTEYEIEIADVILHSGDWGNGDAVATLVFAEADTYGFRIGEYFEEDEVVPDANFNMVGPGRYDLTFDVSDLESVRLDTLKIQNADTSSTGLVQLQYIDWDNWTETTFETSFDAGTPEYFTEAPDGTFQFYPYPDQAYVVAFDYDKELDELDLDSYDDEPANLPEEYHMAIVWAAVEKAGMFDRDRAIVARAQKELRFYRDRMERNLMPQMSFATSRL